MKKVFSLLWLVAALIIGCSSEEPIVTPEADAPEYGAELYVAPSTVLVDLMPTATLWWWVKGEPESVTLFKDGEVFAVGGLEATFTATEVGSWVFTLEVIYDAEHIITRSVTVTATELPIDPDAQLDGMLVIIHNNQKTPTDVQVILYGWGGDSEYSFKITADGTTYHQSSVVLHITEPGDYPTIGTISDGSGQSITFEDVVHAYPPDAPLQLVVDANVVVVGQTAFFGAHPSGGKDPYDYNWKLGGVHISSDRFPIMSGLAEGNYTAEVIVTDDNGGHATDIVEFTIEPVEQDPIIPMAVDMHIVPQDQVEPVTGQAWLDIEHGSGDFSVRWVYNDVVISTMPSVEVPGLMAGNHTLYATVTDNVTGQITELNGTIRVLPSDPDDPEPLTVTALAAPSILQVPYVTTLIAISDGGTSPKEFEWWYNGLFVGEGQSISYSIGLPEEYEFTVIVTDSLGRTAQANVTATGLPPDGTEVITWQVATGLKVGPLDPEDTETVVTNQTGWNRIWFYIKFDVDLDDLAEVWIEIVYSDGTRRYWAIPDVGDYCCRPNYVLVDGGEALVEPTMEVNFFFGDGMYDRDSECTNWDYLLRIHGSREVPLGYAQTKIVQVQSTTSAPIR